jgi:zinc/manganese transport system permease protein
MDVAHTAGVAGKAGTVETGGIDPFRVNSSKRSRVLDLLDLMAAPFAECLVLVAIHTYLGIHVLRRHVIFVDLALAQTAALGTTVGFVFGILPDTTAALIYSMVFTFLAAAVFALTRIRTERVPQEALIGLFYAIMAAGAVLVVQKTHGAEHMDDILVGSLLWVQWDDVAIAAGAYLFIGIIHVLFRKQFLFISENPEEAYRRGMWVRGWDFLFYLTFGFVITFSVRVAGVLLVFVFLVAPAIMAFMITDRLRYQLLIGWAMGTVVTSLGLYLSYIADLPSGPTVVAFYGVVLVVGALGLHLLRSRRPMRSAGVIGAGVAASVLIGVALYGLGGWLAISRWAQSDEVHRVETDIARVRESAVQEKHIALSSAIEKTRSFTGGSVPQQVIREYAALDDFDARLTYIENLFERNQDHGYALLVSLLADSETPPFFRAEAVELMRAKTGNDFEYDPELDVLENRPAIDAMRKRLLDNRGVRAPGIPIDSETETGSS